MHDVGSNPESAQTSAVKELTGLDGDRLDAVLDFGKRSLLGHGDDGPIDSPQD
jgi:hypothetical protein